MSEKLGGRQVVDQIREAIAGRTAIELALPGVSWWSVYAGDVPYIIGGWRITFFCDCDELDYCDSATSPEGITGDIHQWLSDGDEPVSLLTSEEVRSPQYLLDEAK